MKKMFFAAMTAFVIGACPLAAQNEVMPIALMPTDTLSAAAPADSAATSQVCHLFKIASLSYSSILQSLPEYHDVMRQFNALAASYEAEAIYNETNFKRKFSEYLQGQKDFPKNILLRRQKDLQSEMEKAMAFRTAADSLLLQAKQEMLAPVKAKLNAAIQAVGEARGYLEIINTDLHTHLFINSKLAEDATSYVLEYLNPVSAGE